LEYFETKRWRIPWANLTGWLHGDHLKTLILQDLNHLFDTFAQPLDRNDYFKTFPHLESLDLQKNKIDKVVDGAFSYQTKLKHLNLKKNWLRKITPGMFAGLDQLTTLDLSSNFFGVIAIEDFGDAWHTEPLLTVNLKGNPFECGCDMIENAKYFNNTGYKLVVDNLVCASPTSLKGKYKLR
jgi:hypothetical protein